MRHSTTQSVSLEIETTESAQITVEVNGHRYMHPVRELLHAGRSHYLRGWLSAAVRIGPLIPIAECQVDAEFIDEPERDIDIYRLQVAQTNGQWVWLTPIWAER